MFRKLLFFILVFLVSVNTSFADEIFTLNVGECNNSIRYCGMINNNIFSVSGLDRGSVNLYYPADVKTFEFKRFSYCTSDCIIFRIVAISKQSIVLEKLSKDRKIIKPKTPIDKINK